MPKDYLVNIDRSWNYFSDKEFLDILEASGKSNQLFIKCRMNEKYFEDLNEMNAKISFVPIFERQSDLEIVLSHENIKTIGSESVMTESDSVLLDMDWLESLEE